MMDQGGPTTKLRSFVTIWLGQFISQIGSGLSGFALGVWVFQQTGSVTKFAVTILLAVLPNLILGPIAGALVDRWDKRKTMVFSDAGSGLCTLILALLLFKGDLQVWHIYIATVAIGCFGAFRWLAYSVITVLLIPKRHLGRANGLIQLGQAAAPIISPLLAGVLVTTIQIRGVLLIDFATFVVSLLLLAVVRVPKVETASERKSLLGELTYGWTYITARPGLMLLLMSFALTNFGISFLQVLLVPLILSFSSPAALGTVLSLSGTGLLVGSLAMSVWGGPKRRIKWIIGLWIVQGLLFIVGGLQANIVLIGFMVFGNLFCAPLVQSCSQVIWQRKTALDVQARVFAVRRMIGFSCTPLAYLLAGPLADKVFEPMLASGGSLAGSIGRVIGVGPGRGTGLLTMVLGVFIILTSIAAYMLPRLRNVEEELSDVLPDEPPPSVLEAEKLLEPAGAEVGVGV